MSVRIHQLSALDAVASLKGAATGLSSAEVERRLHEFGLNEVQKMAGVPLWLRLVKEFIPRHGACRREGLGVILPFALGVSLLEELRKWLVRRRLCSHPPCLTEE